MQKYVVCIYFIFHSILLSAQPLIEWQRNLGGTMLEGLKFFTLNNNCYILYGSSWSDDHDLSVNYGKKDLWIVMIDSKGNILWNISLGGGESDQMGEILRTPNDGFLFSASTSSSGHNNIDTIEGYSDVWIFEMDLNGNILWSKTYGGSGSESSGCLIPSNDGEVIFLGSSYSSDGDISQNKGEDDIWMMKLDWKGNKIWSKNYGTIGSDNPSQIIPCENGYIIAGQVEADDINLPGYHGKRDWWLLRIDENGNIIWEKFYGGSNDESISFVVAGENSFLVGGRVTSRDGDIKDTQHNGNGWLVNFDYDGNERWQKRYGGSGYDYLDDAIRVDDGYVILGSTSSEDGDLSNNYGNFDIWLFKVDLKGNMQWQQNYGGTIADFGRSLIQTADGGFMFSGDSNSSDIDLTGNYGNYDAWIVKLSPEDAMLPESCQIDNMFPNPLSGTELTLAINQFLKSDINVQLHDTAGRLLWDRKEVAVFGKEAPLILPQLVNGLYILTVDCEGTISRNKLVITSP